MISVSQKTEFVVGRALLRLAISKSTDTFVRMLGRGLAVFANDARPMAFCAVLKFQLTHSYASNHPGR